PTAALAGLKMKGYAQNIAIRPFLDYIPRTATNPEKGFVGSPYVPDPSKRTRTTIYPTALARYCNSYCNEDLPCADISGYSIELLRQELLAGNGIVAYMTLKWEKPYYRTFLIEGMNQRLVSNNHAVLVCGYDPNRGYFISDPYNNQKRNQVYQYWENAKTFENIWNERRVGMVIR
ncbi:MAG: C39 family peptidase, partial [Evtepia sp.]